MVHVVTVILATCRLMHSAIAVLAVPNCLDAARNAALGVVENLLESEGELGNSIIMAHVNQLLESLKAIVVTAWTAPVNLYHCYLSQSGTCVLAAGVHMHTAYTSVIQGTIRLFCHTLQLEACLFT